jgi:hypothetical protein
MPQRLSSKAAQRGIWSFCVPWRLQIGGCRGSNSAAGSNNLLPRYGGKQMKKKPTMMLNEDEAFDGAGNEILALTKKLIDNGMARRNVIAAFQSAGKDPS